MPVITDQSIADCYQPLFDLLYRDHNITATNEEMDDIISAAEKVKEKLDELFNKPNNQ